MSQQDKKEFTLSYQIIDIKNWDPKINTRPARISFAEYFPGFGKAFDRLQSFDKRTFNEELVIKSSLPQIVTSAAIFGHDANILLMSRYIRSYEYSDLRDGVYLEISTNNISKKHFEMVTGYDLGTAVKRGPQLEYFLVPETSVDKSIKLNANDRELLRRINKGPRRLRDDDEWGLKI